MADVDIEYTLDPSGYLTGVSQIDAANQRLQASMGGVASSSSGLSKALSYVTPSRAAVAGMGLFTKTAADAQQQLSTLAGTATVTHVSVDKLAGGIKTMARDLPIGRAGATQLVEQFTKVGITGGHAEKQIVALANASAKLGGATGENASQLAQSLTDLSRATGNRNLDPKRFQALGDSLVSVSAKMGASATDTTAFAKAIAPMANQAGIGSAAIVGISSSFAKLGEDGAIASNAMNKMLGDMTRSVREGGPQMKAYAQIAGMTADQFERLFKNKPTEALSRIFTSIAAAGPSGPRMLEMVGIEGVRSQRAITNVVAGGGLEKGVAEAVGAYGGGATNKAAEAAFGGLNDSMGQLKESTTQVSEAFGKPLLGPLTELTDGLAKISGGIGKVLGSDAGQKLISGGLMAAVTVMAFKGIAGPLGILAMGRQAATSGPLRSLAAGYARARQLPETSFLARYGAQMQNAADEGTLSEGFLGPTRERLYNIGAGAGRERLGQKGAYQARSGPSVWARGRQAAQAYSANALQTYMAWTTQSLQNAAENDVSKRDPSMLGGTAKGVQSAVAAVRQQQAAGGGGFWAGVKTFDSDLRKTTGTTANLRGTFTALGAVVQAQGAVVKAFGEDLKGVALSGVSAGAGALRGLLTNPLVLGTLAVTAITAVGKAGEAKTKGREEELKASQGDDIYKTVNAYRDSIGAATEATVTFADVSGKMSQSLSKTAEAMTPEQVVQVSGADKATATEGMNKVVNKWEGTADQIASQIQLMHGGQLTVQDVQAVKVDLLKQMSQPQVENILGKIAPAMTATKTPADVSKDTAKQLADTVNAVAKAPKTSGFFDTINNAQNTADTEQQAIEQAGQLSGGKAGGFFNRRTWSSAVGGGQRTQGLTAEDNKAIDVAKQGIDQQFTANSSKFQATYGTQERAKGWNDLMKAAIKSKNPDLIQKVAQEAGVALGGEKLAGMIWDVKDMKDGNIAGLVAKSADASSGYKQAYTAAQREGANFTEPGKGIQAQVQLQPYVQELAKVSTTISRAFDPRAGHGNVATAAVLASVAKPEDFGLQSKAIDRLGDASMQAGESAMTASNKFLEAATHLTEGTAEWNAVMGAQAQAQAKSNAVISTQGSGQAILSLFADAQQRASITPTTSTELNNQKEAQKAMVDQAAAGLNFMRQTLSMYRQAGIQESRARQDSSTQVGYMKQDYATNVERATAAHHLNLERMQHQYQQNVQYSEEDFGIQREHTLRDFHISMARAEEDYQISRAHQIRDFNKQLARTIEEGAKSMYDVYSRIQTKATWDAQNLLVNMAEQTQALVKQKAELEELRKMGLSAQSIDILGLGKTENAAQVSNMVADIMTDPGIAAQINAAAAARGKAAAALTTDASNTELKHQKEDLAQALADAAAEHKKNIKHSNEDLARGLADSSAQFALAEKRNLAQYDYTIEQANKDLRIGLGNMARDEDRALDRQSKALTTSLGRMHEDLVEGGKSIGNDMDQIYTQYLNAIGGHTIKWGKIITDDSKDFAKQFGPNVKPVWNSTMKTFGFTMPIDYGGLGSAGGGSGHAGSANAAEGGTYSGGSYTSGGGSSGSAANRAEGGSIEGYSPHAKADNIQVMATAGEYMHSVDAVKHYGVNTMDAINAKAVPKEALEGYASGGLIEFGRLLQKKHYQVAEHPLFGGVHPVHTAGSQHYNKQGPGGGGAIDVNHDQASEAKFINAIVGLAGAYGLRTIWQVAGHYNHAHFDISKGPDMLGKAVASLAGSRAAGGGGDLGGGGGGGAGGPGIEVLEKILERAFDHKRKGAYGALRDSSIFTIMNSPAAKWLRRGGAGGGAGGGLPGGDTGSHTADARANQAIAMGLMGRYGFSTGQFGSLVKLWNGESGWNQFADNPSSDAYGIPQSLPGSKMASAGRDWKTNPATQIKWGLGYIKNRYGSPDRAWAAWNQRSPHWYDEGGWMKPGATAAMNGTRDAEAVLTKSQWNAVKRLAARGVSGDDFRSMASSGGMHMVVNNQSYNYDHRNEFAGAHFTVQSSDPGELVRKLEAIAVAARLTETRGVRRNPR